MPLGHIGISVPDLKVARAYYDAAMPLVGYEPFLDRADEFLLEAVCHREEDPGV